MTVLHKNTGMVGTVMHDLICLLRVRWNCGVVTCCTPDQVREP